MSIEAIDFSKKSPRNRELVEQYKPIRRQRRHLRSKLDAPRFGPGVDIPDVPEGMELYKFHGVPAFLPVREKGELLIGQTPYTQRQLDELERLKKIREGVYIGDENNPNYLLFLSRRTGR